MFKIVARKFKADAFGFYVRSIGAQGWVERIVLHNTAVPSLAQRPGGVLTAKHISSLQSYYSKTMGWSGGPHLFVDAEGIWVFNPLDDPGVHSPSWNRDSWGVEMLGNYEREAFDSGLGLKVRSNAVRAIAELAKVQGWPDVSSDRLVFHKDDPRTTHKGCPGRHVIKAQVVAEVNAMMSVAKPDKPFTVVLDGQALESPFIGSDSKGYVAIRELVNRGVFDLSIDDSGVYQLRR